MYSSTFWSSSPDRVRLRIESEYRLAEQCMWSSCNKKWVKVGSPEYWGFMNVAAAPAAEFPQPNAQAPIAPVPTAPAAYDTVVSAPPSVLSSHSANGNADRFVEYVANPFRQPGWGGPRDRMVSATAGSCMKKKNHTYRVVTTAATNDVARETLYLSVREASTFESVQRQPEASLLGPQKKHSGQRSTGWDQKSSRSCSPKPKAAALKAGVKAELEAAVVTLNVAAPKRRRLEQGPCYVCLNTKERATLRAPHPLFDVDDKVVVAQDAPTRRTQPKIEWSNDEVLEVLDVPPRQASTGVVAPMIDAAPKKASTTDKKGPQKQGASFKKEAAIKPAPEKKAKITKPKAPA